MAGRCSGSLKVKRIEEGRGMSSEGARMADIARLEHAV